jgi:glycosyltransferase involved in cell wall biosynthesis
MNVLIAVGSFYDGGAEIFAIRLANALSDKMKIIFVELEPYESEKKNQKKLLASRVKLVQAGKNLAGYLLYKDVLSGRLKRKLRGYYVSAAEKKITDIIKENNIQLVHSHSLKTDAYFSRLKEKISFKLISTLHGHYELEQKEKLFRVFEENRMAEKIDKYIYVTQKQIATLNNLKIPEQKRTKIFYGIGESITNAQTIYDPAGPLKIVMAARGIAEKGWKEAIEACLSLLKKFPGKLHLDLFGEGIFLDELRPVYENAHIHFRGYADDVMKFISDAHIGLLPSYYEAESLPNSVIEYLFCGKPVIATSTGAIEEMLTQEDSKAGILINLINGKVQAKDIANAVEVYLNNPQLVERHSALALKAAQKFDMKNCAAAYTALYHEVVGNCSGKAC